MGEKKEGKRSAHLLKTLKKKKIEIKKRKKYPRFKKFLRQSSNSGKIFQNRPFTAQPIFSPPATLCLFSPFVERLAIQKIEMGARSN